MTVCLLRRLRSLTACGVALFSLSANAQGYDTVLAVDLLTGAVDSLQAPSIDSAITAATTSHYIGGYDDRVLELETDWPYDAGWPNSYFAPRRRAGDLFEVAAYPTRTSVKLHHIDDGIALHNCSASLISRRHLLVAAHCVVSWGTHQIDHDSIRACVAFDEGDSDERFGCTYVQQAFLFKDYDLLQEDFAVLELVEPLGEVAGYIGVGFDDTGEVFREGTFHQFSYPVVGIDKEKYNGDTLYYEYGRIDLVTPDHLGKLKVRGASGQSGSSIVHVSREGTYVSYGPLSWTGHAKHTRIDRRDFAVIESIIARDLIAATAATEPVAEVRVSPNPTLGNVALTGLPTDRSFVVTVVDALGRVIFRVPHVRREIGFDLGGLPTGVYTVQATDGPQVVAVRGVKQ